LRMIEHEHQVRFSKLHDKRAEVIAELYEYLVADILLETQRFLSHGAWVHPMGSRLEEFIATRDKFQNFILFIEKRRIYLPENICASLDNFVDVLRKIVNEVGAWGTVPNPNQETHRNRMNAIKNGFEKFEIEIPVAKRALEAEFRKMLGDVPATSLENTSKKE